MSAELLSALIGFGGALVGAAVALAAALLAARIPVRQAVRLRHLDSLAAIVGGGPEAAVAQKVHLGVAARRELVRQYLDVDTSQDQAPFQLVKIAHTAALESINAEWQHLGLEPLELADVHRLILADQSAALQLAWERGEQVSLPPRPPSS
ncbi:hypothetical protein ACFZCV_29980 [Streptomyces sp. NPDC007920]|uniref:hypothetical protein n=1 Tax=Streptomyces sp. NPDC007920 TaxID=3364794 RepID=UPI0036ED8A44